MSDTSKPATPPASTFKFDEAAFKARVKELEDLRYTVAGKRNYNPFIWFNEKVQPCVDEFKEGKRTEELYKKLMAVEAKIPPLDPSIPDEVPAPKKA